MMVAAVELVDGPQNGTFGAENSHFALLVTAFFFVKTKPWSGDPIECAHFGLTEQVDMPSRGWSH